MKAQSHADDAGIGVVYGSARGLAPGARQLLSPAKYAARTKGRLPAVFDAEATCDLDKDGFTDLIVSTDPPYDGQGRPPVPLQALFGSPHGLTRAVTLTVPARTRFGNDWPDQPACGDFDGDGAQDLVLHASGEQVTYLRGPFSRKGAPRTAGAPIPSPGEFPTGPAADVNRDGYDDLVVRTAEGTSRASVALGGPTGPTRTGTVLPEGIDIARAARACPAATRTTTCSAPTSSSTRSPATAGPTWSWARTRTTATAGVTYLPSNGTVITTIGSPTVSPSTSGVSTTGTPSFGANFAD